MSEGESDQLKRMNSLSWYSAYQSQIVGQPNTSWAQEPKTMNGYDDGTGNMNVDLIDWDSSPNDTSPVKGGTLHLTLGDTESRGLHKERKVDDVDVSAHQNGIDKDESQRLGRTRSFDILMEKNHDDDDDDDGDDGAKEAKMNRSVSMLNWREMYEEYKPPKQFQKPANTKINPSLSRIYITGSGNEKCKKCGHRLYEMEKIIANHSAYHKSCFKCSKCQRLLSLGSFTSTDGELYCKSHFMDIVGGKTGAVPDTPVLKPEEKHSSKLDDFREDISPEVTMTSIANIKSRFEDPSNDVTDSTKKPIKKDSEKNRHFTEDKSSKSNTTTEVNVKIGKEIDLNDHNRATDRSTPPQILQPQLKPVHSNTVTMSPASNEISTHLSEIRTTSTTNEDDVIPVADAFAVFRGLDKSAVEKVRHGDKKSIRKTVPLSEQPSRYEDTRKDVLKEKGNAGKTDSKHSETVLINHSPVNKTHVEEPSRKAKSSGIAESKMKIQLEKADPDSDTENEIPFQGMTKRLRTQWELMDQDKNTVIAVTQKSTTPSLGHVQKRNTNGTSEEHHKTTKTHPTKGSHTDPHVSVERDVPKRNTNGTTEEHHKSTNAHPTKESRADPPVPVERDVVDGDRSRIQLHKEDAKQTETKEEMWIGPLDFTRNQLAKFKWLEDMAQKSANPYTPKKTFRWGVKEVSPLHRTVHQKLTSETVEFHHQPHTPSSPDQKHSSQTLEFHDRPSGADSTQVEHNISAQDLGLRTDLNGQRKTMAHQEHVSFAEKVGEDETDQSTVAAMKDALAQFKMLEDLSRPPPNPVLALSQQKAAISTATRPYHDVIQVSYTAASTRD